VQKPYKMILRIANIRQIILVTLILFWFQHDVLSQEADTSAIKKTGMFIGFSVGPSQSQIVTTGINSVSKLLSSQKYSFSGSVDFGYFLSKYFGLSTGIGYSSYSTLLTLDAYQNAGPAVDSENEAFEMRVTGSGIKEDQKVGFLTVPFSLILHVPLSKSLGFFVQPGINLAIPISKTFQNSGIFTYKGYYSSYNILLEDLPAYGFPTNLSSESSGDMELKSPNFNAIVSAGFDFLIKSKFQVGIAGFYNRSLVNVSGYASPEKFQLTTVAGDLNSLMGGSNKTTAQSMGISIVFRYFLK
jgi:hypothetical protein